MGVTAPHTTPRTPDGHLMDPPGDTRYGPIAPVPRCAVCFCIVRRDEEGAWTHAHGAQVWHAARPQTPLERLQRSLRAL